MTVYSRLSMCYKTKTGNSSRRVKRNMYQTVDTKTHKILYYKDQPKLNYFCQILKSKHQYHFVEMKGNDKTFLM